MFRFEVSIDSCFYIFIVYFRVFVSDSEEEILEGFFAGEGGVAGETGGGVLEEAGEEVGDEFGREGGGGE